MFLTSKKRLDRSRQIRLPVAGLALMVIAGCATTSNVQQIDRLDTVDGTPKIILMPPDIRYYLLTAGGVPEPNAEWTDAAQANFAVALRDYATANGSNVVQLDKSNLSRQEIEYEALHSVVGRTILNHYFGMLKLPSKGGTFDWSLGPDIASIGEDHDADYALFVHYRDYQASGGRMAFSILAAVAGVGVPTGSESGFASLIDLETGDIVWFNVVRAGSGEFRDPSGAHVAVRMLFKDLPSGNPSVEVQ